jgi:hypothetical protein
MQAAHCMTNPWVSPRHDKLIPVNKAVNEKEQLEKWGWRRQKSIQIFCSEKLKKT